MIFLKSVIYRIYASSLTFLLAYLFTQKATVSMAIGVTEFFGKVFSYWIFEYAWNLAAHRHVKPRTKGICLWISGIQGVGKTEVANEIIRRARRIGKKIILLDGDSVREGLSFGLGFSDKDISENIRRIASVAKLLTQQGVNVVVSCVSANSSDRIHAREYIGVDNYIELHVTCSEKELIRRRENSARRGMTWLKNFYDETQQYAVYNIDTTNRTPKESVDTILKTGILKEII